MPGQGAQKRVAEQLTRGLALEPVVGVRDVVERLQPGEEAVELAATVEWVSRQLAHQEAVERGEGGRVETAQLVGGQVQAAEARTLPERVGGDDLDEVVLEEEALHAAQATQHALAQVGQLVVSQLEHLDKTCVGSRLLIPDCVVVNLGIAIGVELTLFVKCECF